MNVAEQIEIGFDIATSLTIVGAISTYLWRAHRDRKQRLNEQTRSTSLERIQEIQAEFEVRFMSLIRLSTSFEKNIDYRIRAENDKPFEKLRRACMDQPEFISDRQKELQEIRDSIRDYYEFISVRRYTIYPILDSLSRDSDDYNSYLKTVKKDISDINDKYNEMGTKQMSLIDAIKALHTYMSDKGYVQVNEDYEEVSEKAVEDEKVINLAAYIALDADYEEWVIAFVPDENEDEYMNIVKGDAKWEDSLDLRNNILLSIIGLMIQDPHKAYARAFYHQSNKIPSLRNECKDILIKLAAICYKLRSNKDTKSEDFEKVVERFETEDYFDREKSIR